MWNKAPSERTIVRRGLVEDAEQLPGLRLGQDLPRSLNRGAELLALIKRHGALGSTVIGIKVERFDEMVRNRRKGLDTACDHLRRKIESDGLLKRRLNDQPPPR